MAHMFSWCLFLALAMSSQPSGESWRVTFSETKDAEAIAAFQSVKPTSRPSSLLVLWSDINGDDKNELWIYDNGDSCVHHLCPTYILEHSASGWRKIFEDLTNGGGITILPERSGGYHHIGIHISSDPDLIRPHYKTFSWQNNQYQELGTQFLMQPLTVGAE